MSKFKKGDRVEVLEGHGWGKDIVGWEGTICDSDNGNNIVGVRFDENIDGHDCSGACEYGYGWNLHERHLKKAGKRV